MNSDLKNNSYDVIDLTESFTLVVNRFKPNTVIELDTTEESFNITIDSDTDDKPNAKNIRPTSRGATKKRKKKSIENNQSAGGPSTSKSSCGGLGECPICCDTLGKNPLASTKCGHVYCIKCLEQSLKIVKKCPTCRCALKGAAAYHPLYLNF